MLNIKQEHLKVFVTVAESGSISGAGERLGRTASAVSMTLSQIESQIGEKLFEGERKNRLTPIGHSILGHARRAVEEHQRALINIQHLSSGNEGQIRIAVVPTVATRLLPEAVVALRRLNPQIHVEIRDNDSATVHREVSEGMVDFGIASLPDDKRLHGEYLFEDTYCLICTQNHRLLQLDRALKISDIRPEEFIVNGLCHRLDHPGIRHLINNSPLYIHNILSILAFIEKGYGISLLPTSAVQDDGIFYLLPVKDLKVKRKLYIISRQEQSLSPVDEKLIHQIRLHFA